jgi:hypothetical protein
MKKPNRPTPIVTKQWLAEKVRANPSYVIGRALLALFKRQTEAEQAYNITKLHNGIGFSANDARVGCIAAKTYLKYGSLQGKLLQAWLKPNKQGLPRIVKYSNQLNEIALQRIAQNQLHNGTKVNEESAAML